MSKLKPIETSVGMRLFTLKLTLPIISLFEPDSDLQERHDRSESRDWGACDENTPIVGAVIDNEVFTDQLCSSGYAADACGKYAF
jgi:hypothetical protein